MGREGSARPRSLRLAEEGAAVVGRRSRRRRGTRAVATRINEAGGRAVDLAFDISDEASVAHLVDVALSTYGGLDRLHCNAAALNPDIIGRDSDVETVPLEVFDRTITVNLRGHFLCTRLAIPHLGERGGGAIVYTASAAAYIGEPERPSYAIAKSGLTALARHVASRWGKEGIRANAIAPGLIMTPAVAAGTMAGHALASVPSTRLGLPEDIAAAVAFLLSDDAAWINGQVLSVDGGGTMR